MKVVNKTGLVILMLVMLMFAGCGSKTGAKDDRQILDDYLANKEAEYTDEEKTQIVTAYKTLLETEGEDYVDGFISRDDQNLITLMGMSVNVYVFRDFKNYGYLNADDSFMNVTGFDSIAGFDVDADEETLKNTVELFVLENMDYSSHSEEAITQLSDFIGTWNADLSAFGDAYVDTELYFTQHIHWNRIFCIFIPD